jgi:hypothetical protein
LISILSAKLSLQELKGDAAGGLQTIKRIRELQSKPDLKLTDEKRSLQLIKQKANAANAK